MRCKINTNPDLISDDDLAVATKREIHFLPPPQSDGTPRAEIIRTASLINTWTLFATLLPADTQIEGKWMMDGYAEFNNGVIVKITRTVPFFIDPKYKAP